MAFDYTYVVYLAQVDIKGWILAQLEVSPPISPKVQLKTMFRQARVGTSVCEGFARGLRGVRARFVGAKSNRISENFAQSKIQNKRNEKKLFII